ncbi:hypothetical protein, variant 1 [Aphanomyces astaci]|uniref:Phosphodiesterase n=1 Tax=Aphanomyces astaci TaxID=112090 RepID=W4GTL0_APHAT|nr:hypothetical protein, variant 1 [Aphanomyces astaci]ETV82651.1 hypothetical protein, variant 1 [Aphanomyces astaci]|eukprot:XP_009828320.1 hypothetical protein, variant 1 [Aphanomyces astaci]
MRLLSSSTLRPPCMHERPNDLSTARLVRIGTCLTTKYKGLSTKTTRARTKTRTRRSAWHCVEPALSSDALKRSTALDLGPSRRTRDCNNTTFHQDVIELNNAYASPGSVAVSSEEIVTSVPGPMPPDSPDAKHRMLGGRGSALNILIGVDMEALVKKELAKISTWNFNVLELCKLHLDDVLLIVGCACFDAENMCAHFAIPTPTLRAFFQGIQAKYLSNPYHNAEHAADVMQCVHHFLTLGGLGTIISKRGRFAALVAAACHDVGHTGYSNNFHINTNDHLAIRYAYRSPLENMHCAVAFELLHSRECDILATLSDVERIEVRNLIIDMVLATDNKNHSIYMGRLDGVLQSVDGDDNDIDLSNFDDQKLLLQVALHAADVSNPVKPWAVYQTWTDRIMTEFYAQGDHERRLALPMSFGCDRHNPIPQAKMQAGFILGIVRPVFHTLSRVPKVHLKHCLDQLDRNLKVWQDQLAPTA